MTERKWQIAIFGTFDVANYGDLLFPIIAEAELTRRLGPISLHRFSYHGRTAPQWPYEVTSLTELPRIAGTLDAVLIGGGFIIRFDKIVAPDYGPPCPSIHHPTGYWLTPALIALQHGIPLIWNAPGMHCNEIPAWAAPLVNLTLEHSPHIKVRDAPSQSTLAALCSSARIDVLPDTAFGLPRLLDEQRPSSEYLGLREKAGLTGPYLVVHSIAGLDSFLHLWRTHCELFQGLQILVLPIGPVLGDHESILGDDLPRSVRLPFWPQPLLLAELICQAEAVVGHSYHLAISALAFGVPVFCSADLRCGKYTALPSYERIFQLSRDSEIDPHWFASNLGKRPISAATQHALDQLTTHWDRIAEIVREGPRPTQPSLNRFWQSLPGLLETAAVACDRPDESLAPAVEPEQFPVADWQAEQLHQQIDELSQRLAEALTERTDAQTRVRDLEDARQAEQLQIDESAQRLAEALTERTDAQTRVRDLEEARQAEQLQIDESAQRLAEALTAQADAQTRIRDLEQARQAEQLHQRQQLDESAQRLTEALTAQADAQTRIRDLEQARQAEQLHQRQQLDESAQRLAEALTAQADAQTRIRDLEQARQAEQLHQRQQLDESAQRLAEALTAHADAQTRIRSLEESNTTLRLFAEQITALQESNSFRLTAPLRFIRRYLTQLLGK